MSSQSTTSSTSSRSSSSSTHSPKAAHGVLSFVSKHLSIAPTPSQRFYLPFFINAFFMIADTVVYVPLSICFTTMVVFLHVRASLTKTVCPLHQLGAYDVCQTIESSYTKWRRVQKQYWGKKWRVHDIERAAVELERHLPRDLTRVVLDFHSDFSRYTKKMPVERRWNVEAYERCFSPKAALSSSRSS